MPQVVAILDDETDRLNAMVAILRCRLPKLDLITFDNAPDMIQWLKDGLDHCALLCLDHDLGPNRVRAGQLFDPGIGRDVVDYLASRRPVCPVVIHTTNSLAAPGMEMVLEDSGWQCSRVVPYDDITWIGEVWIESVLAVVGK